MSRTFNGSTQYLEATDAPLTTYPGTMCVWLKPASNLNGTALSLGSSSASQYTTVSQNATPLSYNETSGSSIQDANATAGVANGVWGHLAVVLTSATSRDCYVNGANKGSNVTSDTWPGSLTTVTVGALLASGARTSYRNGSIAEVAIWNVALTATEITALAAGASPLAIHPGNLIRYWPIKGVTSPETSFLSRYGPSLTVTGATANIGDDPPVQPTPQPEIVPSQYYMSQAAPIVWSEIVQPTTVVGGVVAADLGTLSSDAQSSTSVTVSAPQPLVLSTAAQSSASATVSAPAQLSLSTVAAQSTAAATLVYYVGALASAAQSSATVTVATPQPLVLTASAVSTAALGLKYYLGALASGGQSAASAIVSTPQPLPFATVAGASGNTLVLACYIGALAASAQSTASATVGVPGPAFFTLASGGQSSTSATVAAPQPLTLSSGGQSTTNVAFRYYVGALSSTAQSSSSGTISTPQILTLSSSATSTTGLTLRYYIGALSSAGQSAVAGTITVRQPLPLGTSVATSGGSLVPTFFLGSLVASAQSTTGASITVPGPANFVLTSGGQSSTTAALSVTPLLTLSAAGASTTTATISVKQPLTLSSVVAQSSTSARLAFYLGSLSSAAQSAAALGLIFPNPAVLGVLSSNATSGSSFAFFTGHTITLFEPRLTGPGEPLLSTRSTPTLTSPSAPARHSSSEPFLKHSSEPVLTYGYS